MDKPLYLWMALAPDRRVAPSDAADVFQSLDDTLRLTNVILSQPEPATVEWGDSVWDLSRVGHGDSPLTVDRFRFGSPLQLVTEIPWDVVGPWLGSGGIWIFVGQLERLWNMPGRIRVESKRLKAEEQAERRRYWEERLAAEDAEINYWATRRATSGRHLQGPIPPPAFRGIEGKLSDNPAGSGPPTSVRRRKRKRHR